MNQKTLLYQLSQGEWLMDLSHLNQLRETVRLGIPVRAQDSEKLAPQEAMSFYDENYKRVNARNIDDIPEGSIAVIHVIGGMMKYGNWFMWGADEIIAQLDFANNISNVAAIVMVVDGPGGAVSALPPFLSFAQRKRKPIVALCDTTLSLHYWMCLAIADHIMADNEISARFGSTGVVSSWIDFSKYWEDMGIEEIEVYAEESTHKNEIWRLWKKDRPAAEKMLKERHLGPTARLFQAAAVKAMPGIKVSVEGVNTGRTFGAAEALENKMIHSIGSMKQAMEVSQILAEL